MELHYSEREYFSGGNEIGNIKQMLSSGRSEEIIYAASYILARVENSCNVIEMINCDVCECLCDALVPLDFYLSGIIYNCLAIMTKYKYFFTGNHSSAALETIFRSVHFLIKNGRYDSSARQPLEILELIVRGYVIFNVPPEVKTLENLTNVLRTLLKSSAPQGIKYQTGGIIKSLLDIELGNLTNVTSLIDVCDLWFDIVCAEKRNSSPIPRDIVNLGCSVCETTLRYVTNSGYITSEIKKNVESNLIKNIINFLLEVSVPHVRVRPYAFEKQDVLRLERYFTSLLFVLKDLVSHRQRVTQKLSAMGYIQLISSIMSFSHFSRYEKLGEICTKVLIEILLSLSDDVFVFPDMWSEGRVHFSSEIVKGMSFLDLDAMHRAYNLAETEFNRCTRLSLLIYFYFYCLTTESPAFAKGVHPSAIKLLNTSLETNCSAVQIKAVWFIFVVLQMSKNLSSHHSIFKKMLCILENQSNFSLIYTHHPTLLYWAFSSTKISRKIQYEVAKLWLENRSDDCTTLDDLVKQSADIRLVLFEILQNEHEHSAYLAFITLKNFMLQAEDDALSCNIWIILPQTLERFTRNLANAVKVDYIIDLATTRVPETVNMSKIVRIAALLPQASNKTDLISLTTSLKLTLQLLKISVRYNDSRVLPALLRCESFTHKIVSALDINIVEVALTSLKIIILLWDKPSSSSPLHDRYKKVILDGHSILNILNSTDMELVKTGLVLLQQILSTEFQSDLFVVQGISSDFMKTVLFDVENIIIRYSPLISDRGWICLKLCLSLRNYRILSEDALLHEVIKYGLSYMKETPEMISFLVVWMERRKENEKFCSGYRRIKESYFKETVCNIATFLAENNLENCELLSQKVLECCHHFLIDTSQEPFCKIGFGKRIFTE